MPTKYKNAEIRYDGLLYEVFWHSPFAWHVSQNYLNPDHLITHEEIARLLLRTKLTEKLNGGRLGFLGIFNGQTYLSVVTLLAGRNSAAGRCVVHTSYRTSNFRYIKLLNEIIRHENEDFG